MKIQLTKKEQNYIFDYYGLDSWDILDDIVLSFYKYTGRNWERAIILSQSLDPRKTDSSHKVLGGKMIIQENSIDVQVKFQLKKMGEFPHLYESMGKGNLKSETKEGKTLLSWEHEKAKPTHYLDYPASGGDLKNFWELTHEGVWSTWEQVTPLLKSLFGTDKKEDILVQKMFYEYLPKPKPRKLDKEESVQLSKIVNIANDSPNQALDLAEVLDLLDNLVVTVVSPELYKRKIEL